MDSTLLAIFVIAGFGMLGVGAIAATIYAFYQQRVYDRTTLPALFTEEDTPTVVPDDDADEPIRFDLNADDEVYTLEDSESNELMKSIEKAAGLERKPATNPRAEAKAAKAEEKARAKAEAEAKAAEKAQESLTSTPKKTKRIHRAEKTVTTEKASPKSSFGFGRRPKATKDVVVPAPETPRPNIEVAESPFPLVTPKEGENIVDSQ